MENLDLIVFIGSIIVCLFAIYFGIIVIRKDPKYLLNKAFATFFICISLGFLGYFLYHLPSNSILLIKVLYIIGNLFFNVGLAALLFTAFVFQFSSKLVHKFNYIVYIIFFLISFGFIFWQPEVNLIAYEQGTVSTEMFKPWDYFINIVRIGTIIYTLVVFTIQLRHASGITKTKLRFLTAGLSFSIIGTVLIMVGLENTQYVLETVFKVFGMIAFNICTLLIYQSFKIPNSEAEVEVSTL